MTFNDSDRIIVVDIDGTVCTVEEDYSKCQLMPGCIEALNRLKQMGYKIYLYTGRHINQFDPTMQWLGRNGVPYDHIIFGKPPAKYYVDDSAIRFDSWEQVLQEVQR